MQHPHKRIILNLDPSKCTGTNPCQHNNFEFKWAFNFTQTYIQLLYSYPILVLFLLGSLIVKYKTIVPDMLTYLKTC